MGPNTILVETQIVGKEDKHAVLKIQASVSYYLFLGKNFHYIVLSPRCSARILKKLQ